jgi:hypothetical protein
MEFAEPWMPIYPKQYMDIPLTTLKDKYFNMLKEHYEKEEYVAVIDIKTYLKYNIFSLSTTIKFLLSVLPQEWVALKGSRAPGKCEIIRMEKQEYNTFFKFKLEDTYKNIYMFYILKISLYKSKIIMIYNTKKLEKIIESIDDFNNTFIKIIYGGEKIINNELIKKAFDYCIEVKFRMAIFLFWIVEPNNIIYADKYNELNDEKNFIIKVSNSSDIDSQIEEETFEFYDLLNILKDNEKLLSKKEIEKKEIEKKEIEKKEIEKKEIEKKEIEKKEIEKKEIENYNLLIAKECSICFEKLITEFNINMPCCNISYHLECIKICFNNSNNCPNCWTQCDKDELKKFNKKLKNKKKKK